MRTYNMEQTLFKLQKKLKVKVGLQSSRYGGFYFENGKWVSAYDYDVHIEDLENGNAPESPGIMGGKNVKIDQRNLNHETERGLH